MKKLMESWRGYEKEVISELATGTMPLLTLHTLATEIGIPATAVKTSLAAAGEAAAATAGAAGAAIAGGATIGAAAALKAHATAKGIPVYSETGRSAVSDLLIGAAGIVDAVGGTSLVDQVGAKYYQSPQEVSAIAGEAQSAIASTNTGVGTRFPSNIGQSFEDMDADEVIDFYTNLGSGEGDPPEEPPEEPPKRPEEPEAPKEPWYQTAKNKRRAVGIGTGIGTAAGLKIGSEVGQMRTQKTIDAENAADAAKREKELEGANSPRDAAYEDYLDIIKEEVIKYFKNREG